MTHILVVDDEPGLRHMLEMVLRRDGHEVVIAASGTEALERLAADREIGLVVSDLRMDPLDGLELLKQIRVRHPDVFVVIMTAFAEWDTALRAMRLGAYNFLRKPFDNNVVKALVRRALDARQHWLAARAEGKPGDAVRLVGASAAITDILSTIEQVSTTDSTVLVTGESGSGKELVAQAVHYASLRSDGPFVRINSGALAPSLLESELFGHMKGSFTGAIDDRQGLFALADGGTLFLDEVGDLAPETQVKLLRVLENGEYLPVGGREVKTCNVRVVAATNRDLQQLVRDNEFREDLYYRLAVIPLHLPPLRERVEDIPLLAGHLLARHAVRMRRGISGFTQRALTAMLAYHWPGNVRELDNLIQRGVALTASGDIDAPALFSSMQHASSATRSGVSDDSHARVSRGEVISFETQVASYEKTLLEAALKNCNSNMTEAAKLLGLSFRQMRYKTKQYELR